MRRRQFAGRKRLFSFAFAALLMATAAFIGLTHPWSRSSSSAQVLPWPLGVFEGTVIRNPQFSLGGKPTGDVSCDPTGVPPDPVCEEVALGSIHLLNNLSGTFNVLYAVDWSGYTPEDPCGAVSGTMEITLPDSSMITVQTITGEVCEAWQDPDVPETHTFTIGGVVTETPPSLEWLLGASVQAQGTVIQDVPGEGTLAPIKGIFTVIEWPAPTPRPRPTWPPKW